MMPRHKRLSPSALVVGIGLFSVACGGGGAHFGPAGAHPPGGAPVPTLDEIRSRVVLIGDAGDPNLLGDPVLELLHDTVANVPSLSYVVFLGDNIYEVGMRSADDEESKRKIAAQIDAVTDAGARAFFLPGNHDWKSGIEGLRLQADYVRTRSPSSFFLPDPPGCAGPHTVEDVPDVLLVLLDTEWFLDERYRREGCALSTPEAVAAELERVLGGSDGKEVMVLGHHPLRTKGKHGGNGFWGFVPFFRTNQDMGSDENEAMRALLAAALRPHRPLLYAAGHEHNLQLFQEGETSEAEYFVVSGSGSRLTGVGSDESTLYSQAAAGFFVIDFLSGGRVLLRVLTPEEGVVYSTWLRRP